MPGQIWLCLIGLGAQSAREIILRIFFVDRCHMIPQLTSFKALEAVWALHDRLHNIMLLIMFDPLLKRIQEQATH